MHHQTIVANQSLLSMLHELDASLRNRLEKEQATVGYNLAALRFVKSTAEANGDSAAFFEEAMAARSAQPTASVAELRRKTAARTTTARKKR